MNSFLQCTGAKGKLRLFFRTLVWKKGKRSLFIRIYIVLEHSIVSSLRKHNNF